MSAPELERVEYDLTDIRDLLATSADVRSGLDDSVKLARALGLSHAPKRPYTVDFALSTVPRGWWWHLSHLECALCPNYADPTLPFSNARFYHDNGSPVKFTHSSWGDDRDALPHAILCARLTAKQAALRVRRAQLLQRYEHVATGSGPMVAHPDGTLHEIPYGMYLDENRQLAQRDEDKGQHGSVSPIFVYGDET